jgi:CheY-like chemotaxis protein
LILTDIQIPETDGFEATTTIRQGELKTAAHDMTGAKERRLDAGMHGKSRNQSGPKISSPSSSKCSRSWLLP